MPVYEEKNKNKWTKDGRKFYFGCYYTDSYGNKKKKVSKLYKGRLEAKRAEEDFLLRVATRDEIDYDIMFETVYKEWLSLKKRTIKQTSYYGIEKSLEKNLSFFKNYKLHSIKVSTINSYYDWLNTLTIKIETKNRYLGYLKEILEYARNNYEFDGKIITQITKIVDTSVSTQLSDAEINCWEYEEFNTFIQCVDDDLYFKIFNFLFYTGVRKGEMLALNWNDINFNDKTLSINKTLTVHLGLGTYQITTPKTKNSIRIIDLDDNLCELLRKHYESESKIYGFNKSMFIFGNIKPISATTLSRRLEHYISVSEVKKISPHGFRHSDATMLLSNNISTRAVDDRLGDTVEVIEKTYYHVLPKTRSIPVNFINNFNKNLEK